MEFFILKLAEIRVAEEQVQWWWVAGCCLVRAPSACKEQPCSHFGFKALANKPRTFYLMIIFSSLDC